MDNWEILLNSRKWHELMCETQQILKQFHLLCIPESMYIIKAHVRI